MGGRIDVETDDVAQLVDEARVGGEFELFHPVRLQAVRALDALNGTRADANDLRHHGGGPVGRLGGRGSLGERHDAFGDARQSRPPIPEDKVKRLQEIYLSPLRLGKTEIEIEINAAPGIVSRDTRYRWLADTTFSARRLP